MNGTGTVSIGGTPRFENCIDNEIEATNRLEVAMREKVRLPSRHLDKRRPGNRVGSNLRSYLEVLTILRDTVKQTARRDIESAGPIFVTTLTPCESALDLVVAGRWTLQIRHRRMARSNHTCRGLVWLRLMRSQMNETGLSRIGETPHVGDDMITDLRWAPTSSAMSWPPRNILPFARTESKCSL
jgi:hypothetical protein